MTDTGTDILYNLRDALRAEQERGTLTTPHPELVRAAQRRITEIRQTKDADQDEKLFNELGSLEWTLGEWIRLRERKLFAFAQDGELPTQDKATTQEILLCGILAGKVQDFRRAVGK